MGVFLGDLGFEGVPLGGTQHISGGKFDAFLLFFVYWVFFWGIWDSRGVSSDIGVSSDVLKFADDTKLFREVASRQDSICVQEDLNRLVEWARIWQMQFNENECKVMHLGGRNEKFSYTMNNHVLEETTLEKDLGIQASSDLKVSIHCQYSYNIGQ